MMYELRKEAATRELFVRPTDCCSAKIGGGGGESGPPQSALRRPRAEIVGQTETSYNNNAEPRIGTNGS